MSFSTYYDSGDTGLGGVSQAAGSRIAFLDKVLVNGYNPQTLTSLTSVGTLVTATLTSHGYRDRQFVTISGATPAAYNGTFQIIPGSTSGSTFQYNALSSPGSSATGTLSCIVASLGWSIAFTGTNLRAYQAPTGNRLYLRLDDTAGVATEARIVGYETMTDVNTGINPFPTAVQFAGGLHDPKASAAATRRCILNGNGSCFNMFTDYVGDTAQGSIIGFGDGASLFKTGDAWATHIFASSATAVNTFEGSGLIPGTGMPAHYLARSYTQAAGSVAAAKGVSTVCASALVASTYPMGGASFTLPFPNPSDGNAWTSPAFMIETGAVTPRSVIPGLIVPLHNKPLTAYTIYQGAGGLSGREFMAVNIICVNIQGQAWLEVSNTF